MRGQGAGPRSRALPSSLWTVASLSCSVPPASEKLLGGGIYKNPPPTFPGFSHYLFASGLCIGILKRFNLGNMALDLWELVSLGSWVYAPHLVLATLNTNL